MSLTKLYTSTVTVRVPEDTSDADGEEIIDRVNELLENVGAIMGIEHPTAEVAIS